MGPIFMRVVRPLHHVASSFASRLSPLQSKTKLNRKLSFRKKILYSLDFLIVLNLINEVVKQWATAIGCHPLSLPISPPARASNWLNIHYSTKIKCIISFQRKRRLHSDFYYKAFYPHNIFSNKHWLKLYIT